MADIRETVDLIRYHHRNRVFAMETRKAMDLRLGWFVKTALGWSKALPKAERDAIAREAASLIEAPGGDLAETIVAAHKARQPFDTIEKTASKAMADLAEQLPVWPWAKEIRGFGAVSLAVIVAETGLVSCDTKVPPEGGNYPNPAKLWKRMGLAVMDGVRQGGLPKTASKQAWIEHGYSRTRRSRMWNVGQCLVKSNGDGRYRALYLERKEVERAKAEAEGLTVRPAGEIPKGKSAEYRSVGHIANLAQRYMEKRLLRNLWRAWREAEKEMEPMSLLPPAGYQDAAE